MERVILQDIALTQTWLIARLTCHSALRGQEVRGTSAKQKLEDQGTACSSSSSDCLICPIPRSCLRRMHSFLVILSLYPQYPSTFSPTLLALMLSTDSVKLQRCGCRQDPDQARIRRVRYPRLGPCSEVKATDGQAGQRQGARLLVLGGLLRTLEQVRSPGVRNAGNGHLPKLIELGASYSFPRSYGSDRRHGS